MTENDLVTRPKMPRTVNVIFFTLTMFTVLRSMKKGLFMFTVLRSMIKRSIYVYSTTKSFSVILLLVVTFTVVIFGQIQCKKNITFTVFSFGHIYSVILTSLVWSGTFWACFLRGQVENCYFGIELYLVLIQTLNKTG